MTNKLNKLYYVIILILVFINTSFAQQILELDGKDIVLNPSSIVQINASDGNITAISSTGNLICSANGIGTGGVKPTLSFFASDTTVAPNSQAPRLNWNVSNNPTSCVKSGAWSGELPTNNEGVVVSGFIDVPTINSTTTYGLHCSNCGGSTTVNNVTVNIESAVAPPTITLVADNDSLQLSNSFATTTLRWTISGANSINCTKTGVWGGTGIVTSGSQVLNYTTANTYTYGLSCFNKPGSTASITVNASETIVVSNSSLPAACDDPLVNPDNLLQDLERRNIYVSDTEVGVLAQQTPPVTTYTLANSNWPAYNEAIRTKLTKNKYLSLKFKTDPTINDVGSFLFLKAPPEFGLPSEGTTYSISECPGDFRLALDKCLKPANDSSILFFSTNPTDSGVCKLDKNKEYYFNVINSSQNYNYAIQHVFLQIPFAGYFLLSMHSN